MILRATFYCKLKKLYSNRKDNSPNSTPLQGWVSAGRNLFLSDIQSNLFKPAKSGKNRKPLQPHGMKTAGVIIKVVNHFIHQ